jgi:TRAP-type C4-dicarboxylate transport system substrate-binding protein
MSLSKLRTILGRLAVTAFALTLAAAPAAAQSVMKLANATINDVQHEWQKQFAAELEKRVGGEVKTEIYPASQLGAIPQMAEGVVLGTIESFISPTAFLTPVDPRFQIFDVPGLFQSPEHLVAVVHDPAYRDHLETMFLDKGVRVIGAIFNSPTIALMRTPVDTVDGFKGKKIRTFASPLQMKPMEALGAIPSPLPLSEVVPQLQSGGIDGMLAGMPILTAFKYYDVAKYVTDLNFTQILSVALVNEAWFQSQTPAVQAAIREAGRAAEVSVFPWGVENLARADKVWTDNGGEVLELPADQQQAMMAEFRTIGAELVAANPAVKAEFDILDKVVVEKAPK